MQDGTLLWLSPFHVSMEGMEKVILCRDDMDCDPAFFLKTVGGQNAAELHQKLVDLPRKMLTDADFLGCANDVSLRWFQRTVSELPVEKKARLIPYLWRTTRTTVPQLARTFGLGRDVISSFLGKVGL